MLIRHQDPTGLAARETIYGALDLGTNNCRLLLAVPDGERFQVIDAFSRMTRLGEGLAASGVLQPHAIARTIEALKFCTQKLNRRQVARFRAVATEACRRAANCGDFLDQVAQETGITLDIITPREEASLALAGCAPLLAADPPDALVFDIGGGSTELIHVRRGRDRLDILDIESLPIGVVTLTEAVGEALQDPVGYDRVVGQTQSRLRRFDKTHSLARLARQGGLQMLGTSGTVTTVAGVHLDLGRYDRARIDGLDMDFAAIDAVSDALIAAPFAVRAAHPCIGRERADLVVAGCAILAAICRQWPTGRLRVADRGVREGLLLSMMQADRGSAA